MEKKGLSIKCAEKAAELPQLGHQAEGHMLIVKETDLGETCVSVYLKARSIGLFLFR